jgi:hypothetical protein
LIHSNGVVGRLRTFAEERKILLFSQALDLSDLPWLRRRNTASYWLEMYEGPERPERARARSGTLTA